MRKFFSDSLFYLGIYGIRAFFVLSFLFLFSFSFASGIPNAGTLYEKWLKEVFVTLPTGENGLEEKLSVPTVHRAHAIADETGTEVAWADEDRFLVGKKSYDQNNVGNLFITAPDDTVDAEMKISTSGTGNPELSLGDMQTEHASLYFDTTSGELRVWNGQNGLEIGESTVEFPEGLYVTKGAKVVKAVTAFECERDGEFLTGFDKDANPICSSDVDRSLWVSQPIAECSVSCGGGIQTFDVQCRDILENSNVVDSFGIVDESRCNDKPKPPSERECNMHACT